MVEEKVQDEQKQQFIWKANCFGFIQKRIANEST